MLKNRINLVKRIRNKIKNRKVSIGSWLQIPDTNVAEIYGNLNYDWIAIDTEHSIFNNDKIIDIFRAIELGNTLPIVRLNSNNDKLIKNYLELGCSGFIIPMVENIEHLNNIEKYLNFLPSGARGTGFNRSNLYGLQFSDYINLKTKPIVIAQIETTEGVKNLNEIIKSKILDAIFIGPYDLSMSLGLNGDINNSKFKKTINEILDFSKKNKIPCGIHVVQNDIKKLKKIINLGYTFIAYSIDTVTLNTYGKNPISNG